jgi:hypothetical protein
MPATKHNPQPSDARQQDDGTAQLVRWGGSIVGIGLLALVLLVTMLGGYTRLGATTNSGWFALIVVLMCLPFGGLFLALGVAKWLRNRGRASKS